MLLFIVRLSVEYVFSQIPLNTYIKIKEAVAPFAYTHTGCRQSVEKFTCEHLVCDVGIQA